MKPSKNQPCPCGSEKKYKMCCIGKFTEVIEDYYGLLQKQGIIKEKLMLWVREEFTDEELDTYANLFSNTSLEEIKEDYKEMSSFLDWLFLEAQHLHEERRIIEIIRNDYNYLFDNDEIRIMDEWISHTQTGTYQIQEVVHEEHTFVIRELFTDKEYSITDIKGSEQIVKGDVFFCRVQKIFGKHYISGTLQFLPFLSVQNWKAFVQKTYQEEKKSNQALTYEDFMNTKSYLLNRFGIEKPEFFAPSGEIIKSCNATYMISPEMEEDIFDWFVDNEDDYIIVDKKYNKKGELSAHIAVIGKKERDTSDSKSGIVILGHLIDEDGNQTPTDAGIDIKNRKLTLFSTSEKAFANQKQKILGKFGDYLQEQKESIKQMEEILRDIKENSVPEKKITKKQMDLERKAIMQYYKEWCDTNIPMFEGKTPREVITTDEGRKKVRELLLSMESDELRKQKEGEEYTPVEKIIREELGFYD